MVRLALARAPIGMGARAPRGPAAETRMRLKFRPRPWLRLGQGLFDALLDVALGAEADNRAFDFATLKDEERRDAADAVLRRDGAVFIGVHLHEVHLAGEFVVELFNDRLHHPARATPGRPEIDERRQFGFEDVVLEGCVGGFTEFGHAVVLPLCPVLAMVDTRRACSNLEVRYPQRVYAVNPPGVSPSMRRSGRFTSARDRNDAGAAQRRQEIGTTRWMPSRIRSSLIACRASKDRYEGCAR